MAKYLSFIAGLGLFLLILFSSFLFPSQPKPYKYPPLVHFPEMLPTDNFPTMEGVSLGRFLFYDPILSRDSSFSCGNCHKQIYAFSDSPNQFSKGINDEFSRRNTLPLFNLPWYSKFFWDGRASSIEEQVLFPVSAHDEMDLDWKLAAQRIKTNSFYLSKFQDAFEGYPIDSTTISMAIAQFERTLISNNSKYDQVLRGEVYFTAQELRGFSLLNDQTKGNCLHCHTTDSDPLGTIIGFSNNGLDGALSIAGFEDKGKGGFTKKVSDIGLFKIPSLRNVALTAPYMHDGRFQTLEEVVDFYTGGVKYGMNIDSKMKSSPHFQLELNEVEKKDMIAFLQTLTDSTFISNPDFSNPFQ